MKILLHEHSENLHLLGLTRVSERQYCWGMRVWNVCKSLKKIWQNLTKLWSIIMDLIKLGLKSLVWWSWWIDDNLAHGIIDPLKNILSFNRWRNPFGLLKFECWLDTWRNTRQILMFTYYWLVVSVIFWKVFQISWEPGQVVSLVDSK